METKSKAVERVESRPDQFGISLSISQLRKLVEIGDNPRYLNNKPHGYLFIAGKGIDCHNNLVDTVEIIPYSNEINTQALQLNRFTIFVNNGIIGDLVINLGPSHEESTNQPNIVIDNNKDLCIPTTPNPDGRNDQCCSGPPIPPTGLQTFF